MSTDASFWESGTFWAALSTVIAALALLGAFINWLSKRRAGARERGLENQPVKIQLTSDYVTCCIDETSRAFKQLVVKSSDDGPISNIELKVNDIDFAEHSAFHVNGGPNMELLKRGIPAGGQLSFPFALEMGVPDVTYAHISWVRGNGDRAGRRVDLYDCRIVS